MSRPSNQKPILDLCDTRSFYDPDVRIAMDELGKMQKEQAAKKRQENKRTLEVKRDLTKIRRKEFQAQRKRLTLAMFAAGMKYVCSSPECLADSNLHVDHIIPLSKGGADDVENLQFLCRRHNSKKGSK